MTNVLRDLYKNTKLMKLVAGQVPVSVSSTSTIDEALHLMAQHHVSCLPVVGTDGSISGQIDSLDIVSYISNVIPDDKDFQAHAVLSLQIAGRAISLVTVGEVANASGRDPYIPTSMDAHADHLISYFAEGLHRAMVFDHANKLAGVVSQMTLAAELANALPHMGSLKNIAHRKLHDLYLDENGPVTTLVASTRVFEAIRFMSKTALSAIAIVDEQTGKLIGNFSAVDIEGLYKDSYPKLTQTLREFLSEHSQASMNPITVTKDAELVTAVKSMVDNKVHRLWIVDANAKPVAVFSLTDLFRLAQLPELL
eukprot:ANDGO_06943.mRNA.1 Protein SDS23